MYGTYTGSHSDRRYRKKLKDINSGVVLGIPDEQSFIRMPVIRNYKFVPGTGFVFKGGDIKKVKIPLI